MVCPLNAQLSPLRIENDWVLPLPYHTPTMIVDTLTS